MTNVYKSISLILLNQGAQLKKELSQCVSVIADLPQSNSLRAPLLEQKNTLEEKLGEFSGEI